MAEHFKFQGSKMVGTKVYIGLAVPGIVGFGALECKVEALGLYGLGQ